MLDEQDLGQFFADHFQRSAFRLELLREYAVDTDGGDFQRWLAGEADPDWERKDAWLDVLRADTAAGRVNSRVKVISERPSEYERYACEWGYALNSPAGEDIGIVDLSTTVLPEQVQGVQDFWLIDSRHVVVMHYGGAGRFEGGEIAPASELPRYLAAQNAAQAAAEPFTIWWERRTDLHRGRQVA